MNIQETSYGCVPTCYNLQVIPIQGKVTIFCLARVGYKL